MGLLLSNGMLFFLYEGYQENSPVVYNGSVVNLRNLIIYEQWHGISNNVVCATSKASDQPAHTRSL